MSALPTVLTRRLATGLAAATAVGLVSLFGAGAALATNSDPVPTITGISPASGVVGGGTVVTVTGTGFVNDGTESVVFIDAASNVYTASSTFVSSTSLTVTSPPVPTNGAYEIAVSTGGGESAQVAADDYEYVLPAGSAPTLTPGPAATTYGSPVVLTGFAAPSASIGVFLHGYNSTGYVLKATITADASTGAYTYTYTTYADERYYTAVASAQSPGGLTQIAPTVTGPASRVVGFDEPTAVSGTAGIDHTLVVIHFHKAGTASTDYSITRAAAVSVSGTYSFAFTPTADYRFYVTGANGLTTGTYLYQAR